MASQDLSQAIVQAITDQTADLLYIMAGPTRTGFPFCRTISAAIIRSANATPYVANQTWADATTTVGGTALRDMARASGGAGIITEAVFSTSAGTALQGELWLFDQAVAAVADAAAFSVTAADVLNLVGVIPFNCTDTATTPAISYVTGLGIGFTCIGTPNLRGLVKVMNAPTPASREVLSIRLKVQN